MKYIPLTIGIATLLLTACANTVSKEPIVSVSTSSSAVTSVRLGAVTSTKEIPVNGVVKVQARASDSLISSEINIEPKEGMYFTLWLVSTSDDSMPVGSLRSRTRDVRHTTSFELEGDSTIYKTFVLSMQPIGTDPSTSNIIAGGTLK